MQQPIHIRQTYWHYSHLLVLLLLALLCYWPLAFGILSAKNDNIVQFLPVRFHVSEALRNGHLPLWSPYMYLGYPIHGDMQGGAWNPVVWFLSIFGRYNVTSIHAEILIYIFLSGAGMYRLLGVRNFPSSVRLTGAVAYMMCGYITDVAGSNLPFLAAAAYLPFILAYYYHLLKEPSLPFAIKCAAALSLLLISAYPSAFIITCYILLASFLATIIRAVVLQKSTINKPWLAGQVYMALFFLGLSAPAIISYWHILPFYGRSGGVSLQESYANSFLPACSLSFLLPSALIKDQSVAGTDLIARNAYFNIYLLAFIFCYPWVKKSFFSHFLTAGIIFFFLFSLGDSTPIRSWCYKALPLMDTFRHPSNARLFVIIGCIVWASSVCGLFHSGKCTMQYPRIIWVLLAGIVIIGIFHIPASGLATQFSALIHHPEGGRQAFKDLFDRLTTADLIIMNCIVQAFFLLLFAVMLHKKSRWIWLVVLFIANSFICAQLSIPYTLASKTSPKEINNLLRNFPKGYPAPDQVASIAENSADALAYFQTIGISGFYNKKITTTDVDFTPTFMTLTEQVLKDSMVNATVLANSYVYFADTIVTLPVAADQRGTVIINDSILAPVSTAGKAELKKFWNNGFVFATSVPHTSVLCLQQLHLPGWQCSIDGKKVPIYAANTAYMAVSVPGGEHEVMFLYQPPGILIALVLSSITFLAMFILLLKKMFGEKKA